MGEDVRIVLPDAPSESTAGPRMGDAVAWSEPVRILTYAVGNPSLYPMYLDHRVYQEVVGELALPASCAVDPVSGLATTMPTILSCCRTLTV